MKVLFLILIFGGFVGKVQGMQTLSHLAAPLTIGPVMVALCSRTIQGHKNTKDYAAYSIVAGSVIGASLTANRLSIVLAAAGTTAIYAFADSLLASKSSIWKSAIITTASFTCASAAGALFWQAFKR